jgi:hypothetical protein
MFEIQGTSLSGTIPEGRTSQDYQSGKSVVFRSIIGIYKCLLCERKFNTKLRLKRHYYARHAQSVPNYEGEENAHKTLHTEPCIFRAAST